MPKFGKKSNELKQYLCRDLKKLVEAVIQVYDFSIVETVRGKEAQENAAEWGYSQAHYGQSAHNYHPCFAVDVYPWPTPYKQVKGIVCLDDESPAWQEMIHIFKAKAAELGIPITCGIDFKSFKDAPHIEIADWKKRVKEI